MYENHTKQVDTIYDPMVIKLDKDFNELWRYVEVGRTDTVFSSIYRINKIIEDQNSTDLIYAGKFHLSENGSEPARLSDFVGYIVRLSKDGVPIWKRYYQYFS